MTGRAGFGNLGMGTICRADMVVTMTTVISRRLVEMLSGTLSRGGFALIVSGPAGCHGMDGVALQWQRHCKDPRQHDAQEFAHFRSLRSKNGKTLSWST